MIENCYRCLDIEFDIYDSEPARIPKKGIKPYFVTPERLQKIEDWMVNDLILQIDSRNHLKYIIKQGWLQKYK